MKVKIVLSLFASILLLAGCGTKNDTETSNKIDDSTTQQEEEQAVPSSTIGGGQGTPPEGEGVEVFRN